MNLSLVSSQIFREVTSEQLSVYEGAGYNEVFRLGHEPEEGFSWSSERETLAQFPDEEVESCRGEGEEGMVGKGEDENDEGEEEREDDGDEDDSDKKTSEGTSGSPEDDCPFILPKIWTVNDFLPTMSAKVFNTLWDRYQILDNISQSVSLGSLRSAIQGGLRTSAYTMPCLQ